MNPPVLSRPTIIVGCLMMLAGLLLAGPTLWSGLHNRLAPGVLLEVFPQPLDDGRVRLAVLYEYEIRAGDLPGVEGPARALGYARGDRFGRHQPDLVVSDAEALDFIAKVRGPSPYQTVVFYEPGRPLETARARLAPTGPLSLPNLGLLLLITPPLTWALLILLRSRRRTRRA
jgi:hypothetical protein